MYSFIIQATDKGIFAACDERCISNLFYGVAGILFVAGLWKIFEKAEKKGINAGIPFYNLIILLQIIHRPWWWIILLFIPVINIVLGILISIDLARVFGKGIGFGLALFLFPLIFVPVLGFSNTQYKIPPETIKKGSQ
jgi:hypothetical protein